MRSTGYKAWADREIVEDGLAVAEEQEAELRCHQSGECEFAINRRVRKFGEVVCY